MRMWTDEEVEYLQEKWGVLSITAIAKKLDRSIDSIKNKAYKIGLRRHIHSGEYITINQLMNAVRPSKGYSYTLKQWIDKGLPISKKKSINKAYKVIYIDKFWKWAQNNRTLIDFSKMEENILGKEPDWVKEQRKADRLKNKLFKTTPWTKSEDFKLKYLLSKFKYSYNEIAMELGRTEGAIVKRMSELNIKMRPVKAYNHNLWTDEEVNKVIDLYNKGYDPNVIAYLLESKRGAKAVQGKIERMIKSGELVSIRHKKCC